MLCLYQRVEKESLCNKNLNDIQSKSFNTKEADHNELNFFQFNVINTI